MAQSNLQIKSLTNFNENLVEQLRSGKIYVDITEKELYKREDIINDLLEAAFPQCETRLNISTNFYFTRKEKEGMNHIWVSSNTPSDSESFFNKKCVKLSEFLNISNEINKSYPSFISSIINKYIINLDNTTLEEVTVYLINQLKHFSIIEISYCGNSIILNKEHTKSDILQLLKHFKNGNNTTKR